MSEDVIRPRPVVDPALPEELREGLLRGADAPAPSRARTEREDASRVLRLREGGIQLLGVGFTLFLALFTAGWYLAMVIASISLVAYVTALALRREAAPAVRGAGAAVGGAVLVSAPPWLFGVLPPDPLGGAPWLLFTLLVGMVTADTLTAGTKEPPKERHRDRVLWPEDVSTADHGLLAAVQQTVDGVVDARAELGRSDGLDLARGLSVLREQEWRIASLLARQRELRRGYVLRWQRAASPGYARHSNPSGGTWPRWRATSGTGSARSSSTGGWWTPRSWRTASGSSARRPWTPPRPTPTCAPRPPCCPSAPRRSRSSPTPLRPPAGSVRRAGPGSAPP